MKSSNYNSYKELMQQIADVRYASAVLQWDQETYMPSKGARYRGRQLATLNSMAHELATSPVLQSTINALVADDSLSGLELLNVQRTAEELERNLRIPSLFVQKQTIATHESFHAWIKARQQGKFEIFQQPLQKVIELKREEAELLGYAAHPYDALMNEFDRGLTVKITDAVFDGLIPALTNILESTKVLQAVDDAALRQHFPKDEQWKMGLGFLERMHYDFEAGRQDISEHPFTTNFSAEDVRVTTRVDENNFANMLWSCLHEGGHALYEQGLSGEEYGLPQGEYCSLSIHESQSRLWENCIGRSYDYWKNQYRYVQIQFPKQFGHISLPDFYKMINKVSPSFIRTEADELTYHFHVLIRYEIEKKLISGEIQAVDIPAIWNEMYRSYLGVTVPDDLKGCLQDVHWSHGSFGYFPTYSLGSLYAAQFWIKMQNEKDLNSAFKTGNTLPVWEWLKSNIYNHGKLYSSEQLCKMATGEGLIPKYFLDYAREKFADN